MNIPELIGSAWNSITAKRVYGEPYEKDGVVVIPAGFVWGGGGGGDGLDGQRAQGAGFGIVAHPTGAYEIKGGRVRWVPAIDVNLLITATAAVAVAYLRSRSRRTRVESRTTSSGV
ncbi:sporulation protein [Amycolatopsis lurida]